MPESKLKSVSMDFAVSIINLVKFIKKSTDIFICTVFEADLYAFFVNSHKYTDFSL